MFFDTIISRIFLFNLKSFTGDFRKFTVKFFRVISSMFGTDERLLYPNDYGEEDADKMAE